MSDSIPRQEVPTPPITHELIRWMESLLDKPTWTYDPKTPLELQAMRMQFVAGRYSVLEEIKKLHQLQKGD